MSAGNSRARDVDQSETRASLSVLNANLESSSEELGECSTVDVVWRAASLAWDDVSETRTSHPIASEAAAGRRHEALVLSPADLAFG